MRQKNQEQANGSSSLLKKEEDGEEGEEADEQRTERERVESV